MQSEAIENRTAAYAPEEVSAEIAGLLAGLVRELKAAGMSALAGKYTEPLRGLIGELAGLGDDPLRVVVIGDFKRGKTTLINAWLGTPVLPADVLPETAAMVELHYGRPPEQALCLRDGGRVALAEDELRRDKLLPAIEAIGARFSHVDVVRDLPELASCILVDTPGANDLFLRFEDTIAQAAERADLIVAVITVAAPLAATEVSLLRRVLAPHEAGRLYVVLNQIDLVPDADDLARLEQAVRGRLGELFPDAQLFGLSALDELARRGGAPRRTAADGVDLAARFAAYRAEIEAATTTRAAAIRLERAGAMAEAAISRFLADLDALEAALALDRAARAEALARAKARHDAAELALAEQREAVRAEVDAWSAEARAWLAGFSARLIDGLTEQVDGVGGDQTARHLGFFVADRLQEALQACVQRHLAQAPWADAAAGAGDEDLHGRIAPDLLLGPSWSSDHLADWMLGSLLHGGGLVVDLFNRQGRRPDRAALRDAGPALDKVLGEAVARSYGDLGERLVAAVEAAGKARREQAMTALKQADHLDQTGQAGEAATAARLARARELAERAAGRLAELRARPLR